MRSYCSFFFCYAYSFDNLLILLVYTPKLLSKNPLIYVVGRFGYKLVGAKKCDDDCLMLGVFRNGNKSEFRQSADIREEICIGKEQCFFWYKIWTQDKLEDLSSFGPV